MNELRKMSAMVGAMLTKEEMDDFMIEADKERMKFTLHLCTD